MVTYEPQIARTEVIVSCPSLLASPATVRNWFRTYLIYRGLDPDVSEKFFWRGPELYQAEIAELQDAFKTHCSLQDWEANILASDVHSILESSIPPPRRTDFQKYVEYLVGPDYYIKLMFYTRWPIFADYIVGVVAWAGFILGHFVATLIIWNAFEIIMAY
ncbi:hypothetical protein F4677DRAFT_443985 [Hypoxylon crocopeplum]|nr:hypothetical protein F4677DRAFT_443985 [Hypoxylon crocopeplum]